MAMKNCRECGELISTSANPCPRCGRQWPHGMSAIVKYGGGLLLVCCAALAVLGVMAGTRAPEASPVAPVAAPQPPPAAPPIDPRAGRVRVTDIISSIAPHAGKQCEAMEKDQGSCRFIASKTFPFMVKVATAANTIAPHVWVDEMLAVFPARIPNDQQAAAGDLMLSLAKVADVAPDQAFFKQLVEPGRRVLPAAHGGTAFVEVVDSKVMLMVTVKAPR